MSPTPRAAAVVAAVAVTAVWLPPALVALVLVAVAGATVADALAVRRRPHLTRFAPRVLYLGVPAELRLTATAPVGSVRVRQPVPPDVALDPSEADGNLDAAVQARRRGKHPLPRPAVRVTGPLGLGAWFHRAGDDSEVLVYPNLPQALALAAAVRNRLYRTSGLHRRGPLGLGTEFESVRDYVPDDDIRQVNWLATARLGRPMSNEFRIEQDRDVICVVDIGRLMAAPLGDHTRLDLAVDAAVAVAAVADELGDRCGALAFDSEVRRETDPRHKGAKALVQTLFDVEPTAVDSDYERAFYRIRDRKRAFVFVFTDLLDDAAASSLLRGVPILQRRHAIAIATAGDVELEELARSEPHRTVDVYRAAAAVDVLRTRARVAARLRRAGADVVEAPPRALAAACVNSYLRAKARARL